MEFEKRTQFPAVKTGEWVVTLLVAIIPIIGIVLLFVWAFGGDTNPSKAYFAQAALIFVAILFVIYFILSLILGPSIIGWFQG